ncbi:MAG: exodeoxyribonuclease small subunit, partial [Mycobacterium sp.]|nr:exodeoxyribonuclease small subunit [Mycobacterium sp.]
YVLRMDSAADGTAPGPALTYEQARAGLEEVVRTLEAGGTSLEESLELWQRGEALAAACQHFLDGARARLEAARSGAPGAASED